MRPHGIQMGYDENGHEIPERSGEPQVRMRVKHTRTVKEGWACSETTVELLAPLTEDAPAISPLLAGYLGEIYRLGAQEARRRNALEDGGA